MVSDHVSLKTFASSFRYFGTVTSAEISETINSKHGKYPVLSSNDNFVNIYGYIQLERLEFWRR